MSLSSSTRLSIWYVHSRYVEGRKALASGRTPHEAGDIEDFGGIREWQGLSCQLRDRCVVSKTERIACESYALAGNRRRVTVNSGDAVTPCSYRCRESPEKAAVAIRRTPGLQPCGGFRKAYCSFV